MLALNHQSGSLLQYYYNIIKDLSFMALYDDCLSLRNRVRNYAVHPVHSLHFKTVDMTVQTQNYLGMYDS